MKIYREKAGIISRGHVWVLLHKQYIYVDSHLPGLILRAIRNWNNDRYLLM